MEIIKCAECGTGCEKTSDCSIFCPTCNVDICPECYHELNGEYHKYCGNNCSNCGWAHCYGCQ